MPRALIALKRCVIYLLGFPANHRFICIYGKYLIFLLKVNQGRWGRSHLEAHGAVVIRVKRVEEEMRVCGSICGRSRNTGDVPASKSLKVLALVPPGANPRTNPTALPPTSLREKLSVDVFKGVFVDDSTGTFLQDQTQFHPLVKTTFGNTEKTVAS